MSVMILGKLGEDGVPVYNSDIADIFYQYANLLEIMSANPFRIRAYRNAAQTIEAWPKSLAQAIAKREDLTGMQGIGKDLAAKIATIVKTGELPELKKLEARMPHVLSDLMKIQGLGPKRVKILFDKLKVQSADGLEQAIRKGNLRKLKGFGPKLEAQILKGIEQITESEKRIKLFEAIPIAESIVGYLKRSKIIQKVEVAGSFRRRRESVGDIDILVTARNASQAIDRFTKYPDTKEILSKGSTRSTLRLRVGVHVDLRVVEEQSFGAAMLYFTGSKRHNIAFRKLAMAKKLKLNEYGLFRGSKAIAGKSEEEIYKYFGLAYIEPELREDQGEFQAARQGKLPKLVALSDIRGDLHVHTKATDGSENLEVMVKAALAKGYEYVAITDHSKHLAFTKGLNEKRLLEQIRAIDQLNEKIGKIVILKGIEVDILENGKLDLSNDVLKELDLSVCSIHSKFNLSEQKQTERLIRAMDNPYFNILGHATGRLIGDREPYGILLDKVMMAAKERGCLVELNAQPNRLDINDVQCRMAKEMGLKVVISTDAHSSAQLELMEFGIFQARRGWLEASDVANTRNLKALRKLLKRK